jgi:hypothetical protein
MQWFRYPDTHLPEGTITHVGSTFQGLEKRFQVLMIERMRMCLPAPCSISAAPFDERDGERHANKFYLTSSRPHIESGDAYHINRN